MLPESRIEGAVDQIRKELRGRLELFKQQGKHLEAQRISARTRYDCEMMLEMGYCPGIENYSQPLSGRPPGSPPNTLFAAAPAQGNAGPAQRARLLLQPAQEVPSRPGRGATAGPRGRLGPAGQSLQRLLAEGARLDVGLDGFPFSVAQPVSQQAL